MKKSKSVKKGQQSSLLGTARVVVEMLGTDQGTIFVFCCGPQIDLWTELRVKKMVKNTFLGGLDPVLDPKFPGPLGFFWLAREYLEVGEKFSHTVNWVIVPRK